MRESHLEKKSMFSVNTLMTVHPDSGGKNDLHAYYEQLVPEHSQEYPSLSKIYFLQLVLRENTILFTQQRIVAKDIWLGITRKLGFNTPNVLSLIHI